MFQLTITVTLTETYEITTVPVRNVVLVNDNDSENSIAVTELRQITITNNNITNNN